MKQWDRLKDFINILPKNYRYAFELRHPSWHAEDIYTLLADHKMAFCVHDFPGMISPRVVTANFLYIRFHGPKIPYVGSYDATALSQWTNWIQKQNKDAYIYFNNTKENLDAVQNAKTIYQMLS